VHYDNDFALLDNEVSIFANQGKVLLIGDFNSRTGQSPDYILNDSTDLNNFSDNYILPIIQWIKYQKEITKIKYVMPLLQPLAVKQVK
jgi:hypothetical protein